ncbi:MAG TPA: peptidoglycan DD-metalloendopeptidase family protein [Accumulibacter sp.]|jgi:lipoprotein NlpD|nr:peptidoglycan DD-metalloendopeptidase family protein [Accumulibacter sp.]HQC80096.1 peptidoglycan DD-metalloendopeptidase family protein [Accumulibacter sp.]
MNDQCLISRRIAAVVVIVAALVVAGCASTSTPSPVDRGGQAGVRGDGAAQMAIKDGYTVKKGDTLYSIALDNGLDYKELAAWNNIENPNLILVGQVLRVKAPGAAAGDGVVVRPVTTGSTIEQRTLAGSDKLKREPKAGKEPYSEQALARAKQKTVEPVAAAVPKNKPKSETPSDEKASDSSSGEDIAWLWPANGKLVGTFSEGGSKGIDIGGRSGDAVLAAAAGKVVYSGSGLRGYGKLVIVKHNNNYLTAYAHNQNVLVKEDQMVAKGQKIAEMGNTDADQVKLHFEVRRQGKPVDPLKHLPQR